MKPVLFLLVLTAMTIPSKSFSQHLPVYYNTPMTTRWSNDSIAGHRLYPRPQLERKEWINLNGNWEYETTDSSNSLPPKFNKQIVVPFPYESLLSGVGKSLQPNECLWYKTLLKFNPVKDKRYLLHFGAVDYTAYIYINGKNVYSHNGGYLPFTVDITDYLQIDNNELIVKVLDPTDKGNNPHGKQVLNPENIYYTPSSGIWQTVWIEPVNPIYISSIQTSPNIDNATVSLTININNTKDTNNDLNILIETKYGNRQTNHTQKIHRGLNKFTTVISIPQPHLWSPDDPFLYDLSIKVTEGKTKWDEIESYFGMRKINIQKDNKGMDRIFLNNKYTYNLGVLDQGFWPDGLYTAPSDSALAYDIKAIKEMGFNTIRKHIKIEPDRWYYFADKIGLLIWQDFVNPPHSLPTGSREKFEAEIKETIDYLYNHPSVVTWVLFNEGWGAYDQERLTEWVKKYDTTRIVNGHSGEMLYTDDFLRSRPTNPWPHSDLVDIHSYPYPRKTPNQPDKAKVIGEFGGIGVSVAGHEWNDMQGWGYIQVNAYTLRDEYRKLTDSLCMLEKTGLSASIYTQPFDVEGEENGLITYDRELIKIPLDTLKAINSKLISLRRVADSASFFVARNVDPYDNDSKFDSLLRKYKEGSRDSILLRRLTLISFRQKKQDLVTNFGNEFIQRMTNPYSLNNLKFIKYISRTPNDYGFEMFLKDAKKIDSVMGENTAKNNAREIIKRHLIPPYVLDTTNKYNWDKIQDDIVKKYGEAGEEAIIGRRMIEYGGFLGNKPDWEKFGKFYKLYFQRSLKHPEFRINDISWVVFQHVNDIAILTYATEVMKYCIEVWDNSPEALDTYANLLHKIQQTREAIEWESKALNMRKGSSHEKEFAETLQKMKDNKPTWPQN